MGKLLVPTQFRHYLTLPIGKNHLIFTQRKPPCCSRHRAGKLPLPLLFSAFITAVQKSGWSGIKSQRSTRTDNFMTPNHQEITWLGSLQDSSLIKVRFILLASLFWG